MLGYMEQSVATALTKALTAVGCFKPKYPFVDAKKSALLYIAYHLKGKSGYRVGPPRETTCLRYTFCRFFFSFPKVPVNNGGDITCFPHINLKNIRCTLKLIPEICLVFLKIDHLRLPSQTSGRSSLITRKHPKTRGGVGGMKKVAWRLIDVKLTFGS